MYGLNIHLISFRLNSQICNQRDKIRVNITTIPEENKDSFEISAKQIHNAHHFFSVNITDQTKKIIFVFRRKSFLQNDPIIASTIVHSNEFPKSKNKTTEIKRINLFEPLVNMPGSLNSNENRKIFGQMQIQMTLEETFYDNAHKRSYNYNISKIHKGEGYSKINSLGNNENDYLNQNNNSLFVDEGF